MSPGEGEVDGLRTVVEAVVALVFYKPCQKLESVGRVIPGLFFHMVISFDL